MRWLSSRQQVPVPGPSFLLALRVLVSGSCRLYAGVTFRPQAFLGLGLQPQGVGKGPSVLFSSGCCSRIP